MRSFSQILLSAAMLLLSTLSFAQGEYPVSGVVINEKGEPVKGATVFIGGSQRVMPTDDNGRFNFTKVPSGTFQLSVQMLGYAPLVKNIIVKDAAVKVDLKLTPRSIGLAQVTIGNNKAWETNYNIFKTNFLGTTENGKQCVIINPEVLNFSTRKGILYADADEFLVIENNRLGYRIKYMLKHFSYDKANRVELHDGEFTFEELEGTFEMQNQWAKTRLQAYQGSFRHFLRSVYANTVAENGFLARPMFGYRRYAVNNKMVDPNRVMIMDSPIKFDSLVSAIDTSLTSFKFKQMLVTYDPKKAIKFAAKKPATEKTMMSLGSNESILVLVNDQAIVDVRGSYVDYRSFFITGKWGGLRVGDQLPIEYKAPMPEVPRKDVPKNQLLASLHNWTDSLPQEKLYLHMDKPYYAQGDTMWFKGYLTAGADHQLSALSGAAYVELVDSQSQLVKRLKLVVNQGTIAGDLVLTDSIKAGNYRVRAYTQWMRNAGEDYFFDKTITVGDPLKNKPVPEGGVAKADLRQTDVQFFPESGSLITGVASRVAFKATGTDGLGVPIGGYVTDNYNQQVAPILTRHAGMGNFLLMPERGKTYTANIKFADSTVKTIPLPAASREGYVLAVYQTSNDSVLVRIHASDLLQPSSINLVAHSSGRVIFSSPIAIKATITNVWLNKTLFPSGIAQFTIFNTKNEPLLERIAFIKNPDKMHLAVNADSTVYNRRGRVQLKLNAKDSEGVGMAANFSVAVIDENKVPVDETAESTIFSHLLLTSDIKGYVERPNYYFMANSDTSHTNRALDNLMLTQGYRRFEWKYLQDVVNNPPAFAVEKKGTTISGKVNNLQGKAVDGASVMLVSLNARLQKMTTTDANGHFRFDSLVFADSARFAISSKIPESTNGTIVTIDTIPSIVINQKTNLAEVQIIEDKLQEAADKGKPAKLTGLHNLKEVKVKAMKVVDEENKNAMTQGSFTQRDGSVDKVIRLDDPEQFQDIGTMLLARIPGVTMETGPTGVMRLMDMRRTPSLNPVEAKDDGSRDIAIMVNGRPGMYDLDDIMNGRVFTPADVDRIQVIRTSLPAKERMRSPITAPTMPGERPNTGAAGYVNIILKDPSKRKQYYPNMANLMPKGFNKTREFYSPKYARADTHARIPDLRTTIYWNPYINTDASGETTFDFYNGDGAGTYRVVVEGINAEGELGRQVYRYKVE